MKFTRRDLALDRLRQDLKAAVPWIIPVAVALWTVIMILLYR